MTQTIEVFADVRCPFTHAGLRALVDRRRALGREEPRLWVRAWPLELVNGEPLDVALVLEEAAALRRQVDPQLFAGLSEGTFGTTSLPALALVSAAYRDSVATGEAVSLALRDAAFEDGLDVSSPDVLARVAADHDLPDVTEADREQVRKDWREGQERGVAGSPHFFVDGRGYFCPTLDIRHVDGELDVHVDHAGRAEFFAAAFEAGT